MSISPKHMDWTVVLMIFCIALVFIVSLLLLVAPSRQVRTYFAKEAKRLQSEGDAPMAARALFWRVRMFGAMLRNEDHPQHRPAAQVALLSPVVFLSLWMLIWIFSRLR